MAIFARLKKHLGLLGLVAFDRPHGEAIRIFLNGFIVFTSSYSVVITVAFLIIERDAKFSTKVQCTGALISVIYCAVVAIIFTRQKKLFFDIVDELQEIINTRKRKYASVVTTLYNKTHANFEFFTVGMIVFMNAFIYTLSFSVIVFASYYNYYVKEMGEDSFIPSVPSE